MASFYRRWREDRTGQGAAAALRAAQCELLAARPHPFFWAPFILAGEA
jgi:CHAT domain-containing protein